MALQQAPAGTTVEIPRLEARIVIDGVLDEETWSRAAVLSGFSQYEPADGRPAAERTEVRAWYSPEAIYFGITAYDSEPQLIRATRADRDNIGGDDHVTIYLDTFLDRRRAFFFAVNPLGIQQDGVRTEGAASAGRMFGGQIDRSPDFLYESRGRVTPEGYVVEVRIPFKSLRYPVGTNVQQWGINIERKTQRTGFVDTWPDTRRASASFLAQGGVLAGIHGMRRGVVFEAQPFATLNAPASTVDGRLVRDDPEAAAGINVRLGFTSISLDATINPDFSQIEADVGQVTVNERFALFVPEKRPFFLEGIELFSTPNQLVYTRRVVEPRAGAKVTGKLGPLSIAYLSAVDRNGSTGGDVLFNIARVRRDVGANSAVGLTVTDRSATSGPSYNRVIAADARLVFARLYYVEGQLGGSWTDRGAGGFSDALWKAEFDRTGRGWGFNYQLNGVGEDFVTDAGFVNRRNVVSGRAMNRFTWYGENGGALERVTVFLGPTRIWRFDGFGSDRAIEGSEFANTMFRLRGEWELAARVSREFVTIDPAAFGAYTTLTQQGARPYAPLERVSGAGFELSVTTPTFQAFDARASAGTARVAIFGEGSEGRQTSLAASVSLRPGPAFRIGLGTTLQTIERERDGSEYARTILPRLRAEFQPTRAFFLRGIAEYRAERRAALLDARTGDPLAIQGATMGATETNSLRIDLLASYQPVPGTVAFLGYGASLFEPEPFGFRDLSRSADGVFVKLAYRFRR
jgi:hypothetical protein